ncbi:hypothetical protein CERSUDRAFT_158138 [Gelatoporia subvermispora B]|uniref:Autophagy-related protein 14 n=1 Tax=Ceriporiopsis subvermispora (strain B) TaxID=914234 RepID=M2QC72_CERS8|nr:hypothetical protein CERSUDRAFT_158138 [Gelatoporia subvermispora B]
MECPNCELKQRQFYCENCLKQHLLSFRVQISHAAKDRDTHVASAQKGLESVVTPARLRRAELMGGEERVREIWDGLERLRKANEQTREHIKTLRSNLSARRRTLAIATSTFLHSHGSTGHSPHSNSVSPQGHSPTPPGSFPSGQSGSPISSSPSGRPIYTRRPSLSHASAQPLSSTSSSRMPIPGSRPPYPIPISSPQITRTGLSTSPQTPRPPGTSPGAVGSHSYSVARPGVSPLPGDRGSDSFARQIDDAAYQLAALSDTIARARSGLVQELVEVFSVVEVGGRPPLGGKAGTKGEWTIGGLVLPVPGDIRRYPPDHINAVLTHTLHFLSLLSFYLGIKLPFEVVWGRSTTSPSSVTDSGQLGVGVPWIGATRGGEGGGWARWSTKYPLHVSSSLTPSSTSTASASRPSGHTRSMSMPTSTSDPNGDALAASALADSQLDDTPASAAPGSAFTTALAMLLYDVCYLAHTQAIEVPLAHAGEVLGNLWAVCCSHELGRKSHATWPLLPPPTPPNFPLDFTQLLQATAANPTRTRARGTSGRDVKRAERIVEEEDGWDLIDAHE